MIFHSLKPPQSPDRARTWSLQGSKTIESMTGMTGIRKSYFGNQKAVARWFVKVIDEVTEVTKETDRSL